MSRTLSIADHLLSVGRRLQEHGQTREAAQIFGRLAGLTQTLSPAVAEEAHNRLGQIYLDWNDTRAARRHLTAALALHPNCAHYHYLLALASANDEHCDPRRANLHYRRCLELAPEQIEYLCDYAEFALNQDQIGVAVRALRKAAQLGTDDPDLLGRIARGFRRAGRTQEAADLLRAALFRHARDRRFRQLWQRHQFELWQAAEQTSRRRRSSAAAPVILPMPRRKKAVRMFRSKLVRTDPPEHLKGPTILPFHLHRREAT
ncbi:MAG: hypothetical protein NZO58_00155 [Gemmataceae bacterium]|nr:hypothetical protein [Gemmataceae bacterium]